MVAVQELSSWSDEDLALEARGGDHLAFGELYRRYHPVVASYVRPKIGDGTDDVIQNVFLAVHKGLSTYRGPRFFPWVYRICVNTVTDELRRRRRRGLEDTVDSGVVDGIEGSTPEEELIARRLFSRLSGALERIPEQHRTVFVLARLEGLEYGEIADLLRIPIGTVKSRMWKTVKILMAEERGGLS